MNLRNRPVNTFLYIAASIILTALAVSCAGLPGGEARLSTQKPHPGLSPEEVVRIQLTAFGANSESFPGIEVAYRFASPANRRSIGSVERFYRMMNTAAYRPMLDPKSVLYDKAIVTGGRAMVRVRLTSEQDYVIVYDFILSNQTDGPCTGCWMTDGVRIDSVEKAQSLNVI